MASVTLRLLYPRYPISTRLGVSQKVWTHTTGEKMVPTPGIETLSVSKMWPALWVSLWRCSYINSMAPVYAVKSVYWRRGVDPLFHSLPASWPFLPTSLITDWLEQLRPGFDPEGGHKLKEKKGKKERKMCRVLWDPVVIAVTNRNYVGQAGRLYPGKCSFMDEKENAVPLRCRVGHLKWR